MFSKKKTFVVLALAFIVVGGASVAFFLRLGAIQPKPPYYELLRRARKAGVAPKELSVGTVAWAVSHGGAWSKHVESNGPFRGWLISVVENPKEDRKLRSEAWGFLDAIQNHQILGAVMKEVLDWMEKTPSVGREEESERFCLRNNILLRVLMTDLPDEEILSIMKRARPDFWRNWIEGIADTRLDQPHGMDEKILRHMKSRAEGLLKYLEATEGQQPPKPEKGVLEKPD